MHPLKNPLQSNLDCFLLEVDSSPCKNKFSCFNNNLTFAPLEDWERIKERYENEQEAYTALILATQIKESSSDEVRIFTQKIALFEPYNSNRHFVEF